MALVKCKECGTEISKKASACPKCGAPRPKRWGLFKIMVALFFAAVVFALVKGSITSGERASTEESTKTPEQREAEKRADDQVARASLFVMALKKSMRNPKSFEVDSALITDAGAICVTYRAENGFGGMNNGSAVMSADGKSAKSDAESGFTKLWNRECAAQDARDVSAGMNMIL